MSVTQDGPAPYAPPKAILDLVQRHRNKGLPSPVDADVLTRSGIPDSLIPRTLQSLKILDLLNDDGSVSEALERIRLATEAEYQQRLAEWLNAAYADALAYIDPATADEVDIRDAFRKYIPTGQQTRMVTLFIGLFTAAGVMQPRQKPPSTKKPSSPNGSPREAKARPITVTRIANAGGGTRREQATDGLPPAISGLLSTLPAEGGYWTQGRRDQFLATFGAVLDYSFKIGEPPEEKTATDD